MDLRFGAEDEAFRAEVRAWLSENLRGEFANLRGVGGPGDEHRAAEGRMAWEKRLGEAGWIGVGWPTSAGGRGLSLARQVIFYEEYARAEAPGRMGHIGENLVGPTLIAFGTDEQRERFLPPILRGDELWCQGYSEPNAGSDLANVQTRAEWENGEWILYGQKTWTSLAHLSKWAFVLCKTATDPTTPKHKSLSYILVPMHQKGVEIRPIAQLTGTSEFNEVFFDGARAPAENVVGEVNGGWKIAMGTLAFERGASTLGQQLGFEIELSRITDVAKRNGAARDPVMRQRLVSAWMGLRIMRLNALRTLSGAGSGAASGTERGATGRNANVDPAAMITKLYWSEWHRGMGKLAMDVLGAASEILDAGDEKSRLGYELNRLQQLFLFTRADTIYAGSSEIQKNLIGERALGLPPEPRAPEPRK